jgi:uncharacterized protein (DUF1015 family)
MARIRPFRGHRYDPAKIGDFADVMAPPYDVVDAAGRAALAAKSPHASIRFILPEGEGDAKYPAGAAEFRRQVAEAMARDEAPSFYVYHQTFEIEGETYTRKGFIGLIELTRFGAGPVLAHERTLAGPKRDRLELMRACRAHLELVFGMFSDPDRRWEAAVGGHLGAPVLESSFDGLLHQLWRVDAPEAVADLMAALADKSVYIADGHHRYETMCAYADELRAEGNPAADFGMIYLSNLDDPGLVVLPTHRIVHGLPSADLSALVDSVGPWFSATTQPVPHDAAALRDVLSPPDGRATFGLMTPGGDALTVLSLRADFDPAAAGLGDLAPALQRLDVVLLHELVLERGLGITKAAQEAKTNLRYEKSTPDALALARDGGTDAQLIALMNATPVSDVVAVCDSGEVMPQKSTFFFPKIPNGLVFNDLTVDGTEDR